MGIVCLIIVILAFSSFLFSSFWKEDFRYENCYMLAHDIKAEESEAKFTSGLLIIKAPFKEMRRGHKVTIQ